MIKISNCDRVNRLNNTKFGDWFHMYILFSCFLLVKLVNF